MRNQSFEKYILLIVFLFGLSLIVYRAFDKVQISALRENQDQWGSVEVMRMKLLQVIGQVPDKETQDQDQWGSVEVIRLKLLQAIGHVPDKETQIFMKSQLDQLTDEKDGLARWRKEESETLHDLVESAIIRLQNPPDCSQAKKLVCSLNERGCGFGCIMHHGVQCLLTALATDRVLIFTNEPWGYSNYIVKNFFSPISSSCLDFKNSTNSRTIRMNHTQVFKNDTTSEIQYIVYWPDILWSSDDRPYDVPSLPTSLAPRIIKIFQDPDAWWIGQLTGYLMRPNETVGRILAEAEKKTDFSSPIVGLHVRRTDKGGEAPPIALRYYMEEAELWFRKYEMTHQPTKRRIYLATDEPKVIQQCHREYPEYEIIDNIDITNSVNGGRKNDTETSFIGTIQDVYMLAGCNYVICTLSSNMGALVYELLHYKHGDASSLLKPLDASWWYLYRKTVTFEALMEDSATNLKRGDLLTMHTRFKIALRNYNHTFANTTNIRTNETKMTPLYKLRQVPRLYNFPSIDNMV